MNTKIFDNYESFKKMTVKLFESIQLNQVKSLSELRKFIINEIGYKNTSNFKISLENKENMISIMAVENNVVIEKVDVSESEESLLASATNAFIAMAEKYKPDLNETDIESLLESGRFQVGNKLIQIFYP